MSGPADDPWSGLGAFTSARIALGRAGAALPTREVLSLALAHARARDAVHAPFDTQAMADRFAERGYETLLVKSAAVDRNVYLQRPDLGRRLSEESRLALNRRPKVEPDLVFVIADGLSSAAVHSHAAPLLAALRARIDEEGWSVGPVVLASQARVALGDAVGESLGARMVVVLVGERPGLSSPDSLGAYLTLGPVVGCDDSQRNCVSNIRSGGLSYDGAAFKLLWLMREAFRRAATGVALKDESDLGLAALGSVGSLESLPPIRP